MKQEQRMLIAIILSTIVCAMWAHKMTEKQRAWREAQKKKAQAEQQQQPNLGQPEIKGPGEPEIKGPKQPEIKGPDEEPNNNEPKKVEEPKAPVVLEADLKESVMDNDNARLIWSNRGGSLKSLQYKKVASLGVNKKEEGWEKEPESWLELIPHFSNVYKSLMLFGEEQHKGATIQLDQVLWTVEEFLDEATPRIEFSLTLEEVAYRKIFTFPKDKNVIEGKLVVENRSNKKLKRELQLGGGAGIILESTTYYIYAYGAYPSSNNASQLITDYYAHGSLASSTPFKVANNFTWTAMTNRYFAHLLEVSDSNLVAEMGTKVFVPEIPYIRKQLIDKKMDPTPSNVKSAQEQQKQVILTMNLKPIELSAGESKEVSFEMHYGSKKGLSQTEKFETLDDYGFFKSVSLLLVWVLAFFYGIFNNYGIAIICLTISIKLVLFPLSKHQQVAMQKYQHKMKEFQPEFKKVQEKYKNDKQKLQEEMMKLYKKHGITLPIGGCLPMFLQLPIFIGLYSAILYSVDLRQASFLWITDLSQPDRLYHFMPPVLGIEYLNILPIIMTISWVIQMKTAPVPDDPQMKAQQQIMVFMPIMMGFMFYSIASGLVLYWLVMQVITIGEQFIIKRTNPMGK